VKKVLETLHESVTSLHPHCWWRGLGRAGQQESEGIAGEPEQFVKALLDRFLIVSRERQLHLRQANDVAEKRGIAYRIGTGGGGDADLDELEVGLAMGIVDAGADHRERQRLARMLAGELSHLAGLPPCDVVVADRAQVHEHDGRRLQSKTYGYYRCRLQAGVVSGARIRIYHRTAVRQQVISSKVFLNTLLHEWVHHYDFAGLQLARSPHTSGFYTRLRWLAEQLQVSFVLPPEPEAEPGGIPGVTIPSVPR